ncbi:hypothetical protein P7C70_g3675, partial [Phenoliferia sp. Uapishka_3]
MLPVESLLGLPHAPAEATPRVPTPSSLRVMAQTLARTPSSRTSKPLFDFLTSTRISKTSLFGRLHVPPTKLKVGSFDGSLAAERKSRSSVAFIAGSEWPTPTASSILSTLRFKRLRTALTDALNRTRTRGPQSVERVERRMPSLLQRRTKSVKASTTVASTTTRCASTTISVADATASTRNSSAGKLVASMFPLFLLFAAIEEESEDADVLGFLDSDLEPFLALGDSKEILNQPLAKAKAPPRSRPFGSAWDDPLARAAKRDFPHLFREARVLNVEGFQEGLKGHPNRPWVESILWSLQHGCWPFHDGLPPKPPPPEDMRKYPERESDLLIIEKQVNSDIAAGWTSPGYRTLPKGVVLCSLFAIHQADKDPVVNDQTKNGLNNGVRRKDTPAIYDGVRDLIRLLRSLGLENFSKDVVLWKLDVSAAFKQMLMHWLWQFRQGIAISHLLPNGERKI